ncbi:MAG: hypothetical protein H5T45_07055 [Thermoplasmatales archaeon]|nr:hypothetical protein [Thermoplasmatales archaeon]
MDELRKVLDYIPCSVCEKEISKEERKYLCTVCSRLNRVVSVEKISPAWKVEKNKIVPLYGSSKEFKPKIRVIEKEIIPNEEYEILEVEEPFRYGEYTLYTKSVKLRGGERKIYFFSKKKEEYAKPSPLPDGYKVKINKKGLPFLKKQ